MASTTFVLVNVVDPYSGATASPYFQVGERYNGIPTQHHNVTTNFNGSVDREGYTVKEKASESSQTKTSTKSTNSSSSSKIGRPDPGTAQAIAYDKVLAHGGWGEEEFSCLVKLWSRESGWNVYAHNASSGAYGIPQSLPGSKMSSAGSDWQDNPATQIDWGLGYIADRYKTPCGALAHSDAVNWY